MESQSNSIHRTTNLPKSLQQSMPLPEARAPKSLGRIQDKKLRAQLSKAHLDSKRAKEQAKLADEYIHAPQAGEEAGMIEVESNMERTARVTQREIRQSIALDAATKSFSLDLSANKGNSRNAPNASLGPYRADYTRNGRHLLLGGRKGHLAAFDWQTGQLLCEVQVKETVRDVKWLHNKSFFAAAQKKYVYIYDSSGAEVHRLRDHIEVTRMEFLPYHFLLATVGNAGWLKYQDTSTGGIVAQHRSGLGACHTMAQNPLSALIHLGHANGTVTMWTPNLSSPAIKMLAHRGPLSAISLSTQNQGRDMATSGLDGSVKVWDIRMLGRGALREWQSRKPASDLKYSQRGLLGVAWGSHVSIYDPKAPFKAAVTPGPYLTNGFPSGPPISINFCPFEDVLGVAHAKGFDSLVIPGAGEPRYDSTEIDPYEGKNSRREREVHALLDKIQPEMITLDPETLGQIDHSTAGSAAPREESPTPLGGRQLARSSDGRPYARLSRLERLRLDGLADEGPDAVIRPVGDVDETVSGDGGMIAGTRSVAVPSERLVREREKKKARGKNSSLKRYLRKQKVNVIDPKALAARERLERSKEQQATIKEQKRREELGLPPIEQDHSALALFSKKKRRAG
ncbi:BING4CT-domain-containing protein [Ceraceosorus guamensis]|uniref:U three protein 7 n=1 Tax=Ceraceosorus guamensis TaxID=1522189 RepID=A0A316VTF3_9BASI|nr:BING4CT-domain-containing protein [Ceraceosorus guamensis]PWN40318.1 BING4CT-domain-containing protein [Ceraceosorus guamensis]